MLVILLQVATAVATAPAEHSGWIIPISVSTIGMALTVVGFIHKMGKADAKVESKFESIDTRFITVEARVSRVEQLGEKIDNLVLKMTEQFGVLNTSLAEIKVGLYGPAGTGGLQQRIVDVEELAHDTAMHQAQTDGYRTRWQENEKASQNRPGRSTDAPNQP